LTRLYYRVDDPCVAELLDRGLVVDGGLANTSEEEIGRAPHRNAFHVVRYFQRKGYSFSSGVDALCA